MTEKVEIALCMGSSCFMRGNNILLRALEDSIRENAWEDRVALSGLRCENRCGQGPNVFVDGKLYQGLDAGTLLDLLFERLGRPQGGKPSIRF
ncbi:MAG: (2Fe-2S) ferredoxin domain-containing protein [Planctomycetota bacterium]|jgi:NADH:ubiquinone oxidoreductase subunit E|nr:(2Fe-2S) ferredoxin domain-containing protein [Planctomycetota bacterium]